MHKITIFVKNSTLSQNLDNSGLRLVIIDFLEKLGNIFISKLDTIKDIEFLINDFLDNNYKDFDGGFVYE